MIYVINNDDYDDDDKIPTKQESEFVFTSVTQLPPSLSIMD